MSVFTDLYYSLDWQVYFMINTLSTQCRLIINPVNLFRTLQNDFPEHGKALQQHVRQKAARFGSTIVYLKNGMLLEEDPKTHQHRVLKQIAYKNH